MCAFNVCHVNSKELNRSNHPFLEIFYKDPFSLFVAVEFVFSTMTMCLEFQFFQSYVCHFIFTMNDPHQIFVLFCERWLSCHDSATTQHLTETFHLMLSSLSSSKLSNQENDIFQLWRHSTEVYKHPVVNNGKVPN